MCGSESTPLNNQLPVPTRQNSVKSFRSLSSHNGYVPIDPRDAASSGGGGSQRLHSRQSSFRSVVGSLLFDSAGPPPPHPTCAAADYQYNDLSPPEQQLNDDPKDGCELCECHRDADSEASTVVRPLPIHRLHGCGLLLQIYTDTDLACYNSDALQPISVILGKTVAERVSYQIMIYFSACRN